jgi:hypothetical protein
MGISSKRVISIGPSSEKSLLHSAALIIVKPSVCTAPLRGEEKMPYTNSQERSLINIRPSKSAM